MSQKRPEYLTVREVADLLRVKSRTVYALAAKGELPCSRATGKILFPRVAVERWLDHHGRPPAAAGRSRPEVFVGSHDPLLEWALRESRSGIASFFDGSLDGLARFGRGEAIATGLHLLDPRDGSWNIADVSRAVGEEPVVLVEWAWRMRGLIVAAGNPLRIAGIGGLRGRRVVPRQAEAASQHLLLHLLSTEGISTQDVLFIAPPARNETDLALAVADDKADAALGLACAARPYRLDFVPVMRERYDILVWRRFWFEEPFQRFLAFCRSPEFVAHAAELGGYDVSGLGTVHFNGS